MPRFVMLEHDWPALHWDLMLECGETLRTWRLNEPLPADAAFEGESLPDHRRLYLDYEGPVSENRGTVRRVESGVYSLQKETVDELVVDLEGQSRRGRLHLRLAATGRWNADFQSEDVHRLPNSPE